jgi:uncharacterized membrane protein YciS (DUF1049 family)
MRTRIIVVLVIALVAVFFAGQNTQPITITFLFWQYQRWLALVLLLALALGVGIGMLISTPSWAKSKLSERGQRKKIDELETTLATQKTKLTTAEGKIQELETRLKQSSQPPEPPADIQPGQII